jgi:hypothetical protein
MNKIESPFFHNPLTENVGTKPPPIGCCIEVERNSGDTRKHPFTGCCKSKKNTPQPPWMDGGGGDEPLD